MRNPATNLIAAFLICAGIFLSSESANAGPRTKGLSQESRAAEIVGTSATIEAAGPDSVLGRALAAAAAPFPVLDQANASLYAAALSGANPALADSALQALRDLSDRLRAITGGAFGMTFRPIALRWYGAAGSRDAPLATALDSVLARLGFELPEETVQQKLRRLSPAVSTALDGMMKGQAADEALVALRGAGTPGGIVRIGTETACFGAPLDAKTWQVAVVDPWSDASLGVLHVPHEGDTGTVAVSSLAVHRLRAAVYRGAPAPAPEDQAAGVTVIAPDLLTANIWAAALSLLPVDEGMTLVERDPKVEAFWLLGTPDALSIVASSGVPAYISSLDPRVVLR